MQEILLDTDILSYFLRGDKKVVQKTREYLINHSSLIFSQITYFEILAGLEYKQAIKQIHEFEKFALRCVVLKLNSKSLKKASIIYGQLRRKGIQIGTPDLLIAGLAIENEMELATNNVKHYQNIEGLKIQNWKI